MAYEKKKRAVNIRGNPVGMQRYQLYKQAYGWIHVAIKSGFYLEAITLIDSLITDQLESYLSNLLDKDVSFQPLGPLIQTIKNSTIIDDDLRKMATTDLNEWRDKRNKAVHAMVKLEEGDTSTWEDRKKELQVIAEEGREILHMVKLQITNRKNKMKSTRMKTESNNGKKTVKRGNLRPEKNLTADERLKLFRERMDRFHGQAGIKKDNIEESTPIPEPMHTEKS